MTKIRGLSATQLSADSVRIDWLPVKDAPYGYSVLRGAGHAEGDPPRDCKVVARRVQGASFVDTDVSGDVTYWVARSEG